MQFARAQYMKQLMDKKDNGRVKIITGIQRCGKSYLLFTLFADYLRGSGVQDEQIIGLALDELPNAKYRNPMELDKYVRDKIQDGRKRYYVLIDEIQFVAAVPNPYVQDAREKITFIDVILGWMNIKNADVYVTGSNSRMLSTDILTQFRDRGDEIRVFPLSFAEFYEAFAGDKRGAWQEYCTYGGMPLTLSLSSHEEKSRYLQGLFTRTYLRDVVERHSVENSSMVLEDLVNILASSIGSLTNPSRLSNTFESEKRIRINPATIDRYIGYFVEAFLLHKAQRFDVKGRKYIQTPVKYYFTDVGLRNARLGFRQQEENHILENVLFCDLLRRGFNVDVGVVDHHLVSDEGAKIRKQLEVDFVVNRGNNRYYVQTALNVADRDKRLQETASLLKIQDSFRKIVVVREYMNPWRDDNGILFMGVEQFLLDEGAIDL